MQVNRSALVSAVAALLCVAAAVLAGAQSSYRSLTPGTSTRADVERVLGAPARGLSSSAAEYRAPSDGLTAVVVEFAPSGVAARIEVRFDPPVTRRALAASFGLPDGDGLKKTIGGRLVEYFTAPALLGFTYVSTDVAAGVAAIEHFDAATFSAASGLTVTPSPQPPPQPPSPQPPPQPPAQPQPPPPSPPPGPPPSPPAGPQPAPPPQSPNSAAFNTGVAIGQALAALFRRNTNTQWSVNQQASLEGYWLAQYVSQSAEHCQADCQRAQNCVAYVLVRAGATRAGDPAMCYLMSSVTRAVASPCCIAGVKGGK